MFVRVKKGLYETKKRKTIQHFNDPGHAHLIVFPLLPVYDIALIVKAIKQSVTRKAKYFICDHNPDWLEKLTIQRGAGIP